MTTRTKESIENKTFPVKLSTAVLIIISTMTTEASLIGVYNSLKSDIKDVSNQQTIQSQINNMRFNNIEGKQTEDHEWLRALSHRLTVIEQQNGVQVNDKNAEDHK